MRRSKGLPRRTKYIERSRTKAKRSAAWEMKPVPPRKKHKKRKPSEFQRIYGGKERVAWVAAQPCLLSSHACNGGVDGHHTEAGGMGRKADACTIVPLCRHHHTELHQFGAFTFERRHRINLALCAYLLNEAWLARLAAREAA